ANTPAPPDPLQGRVTSFAQVVGQPGSPQQANDRRRGLEQRIAADPSRGPDTSGWTRDQRGNYETQMATRRFDADQQRARGGEAEQRQIRQEGRQEAMQLRQEQRQLRNQLTTMAAQDELQTRQAKMQFGLNFMGQAFQSIMNNALQMN